MVRNSSVFLFAGRGKRLVFLYADIFQTQEKPCRQAAGILADYPIASTAFSIPVPGRYRDLL